jgi:hypothetical protein
MIDPDLSPASLQDRVVWGAEAGDVVRLHGAITAALNLYPRGFSYARVFAPALDRLSDEPRHRAQKAITSHLRAAHEDPKGARRPAITNGRWTR